jgi:hypothetical protein
MGSRRTPLWRQQGRGGREEVWWEAALGFPELPAREGGRREIHLVFRLGKISWAMQLPNIILYMLSDIQLETGWVEINMLTQIWIKITTKGKCPCRTRPVSFIDLIASSFWQCGVWSGGCKVWGCLIMFGCFVNLWEVDEAFFKKSIGSTGGLYWSLRVFFGKLWAAKNFPQKFRGAYVKTNSGVFGWIVTKFEVLFWQGNHGRQIYFSESLGVHVKSWTANIFSWKCRSWYVKIRGPQSWFLLNGSFLCKMTIARSFWAVRAIDPMIGRGKR